MILHVDTDAFFASVEQLDNPKLADKSVIVGQEFKGICSEIRKQLAISDGYADQLVRPYLVVSPNGAFTQEDEKGKTLLLHPGNSPR